MVDWGRVLAGGVGGAAKGALDYDVGVKQDARETRRQEAINKQQMALAKYTTGAAADRQTQQIASSEKLAGESVAAQTATADANRTSRETISAAGIKSTEAGRGAQVAENIRQEALKPSGWTAEDGTIIPQGVFDKATPDQKKRWKSPAAQKLKLAKIAAAAKNLEFQRDIVLKKLEAGKTATAGPKDVQKTLDDMEKAFMFKGDETPEMKKNKAKEYMKSIGWTGSLLETATTKEQTTPRGGGPIDPDAMAKNLAAIKADKTESINSRKAPSTTATDPMAQQPGALDTSESWKQTPLGRAEANVKTIPSALDRASVTNAEALSELEKNRTQGSLIPGVNTFKR